MSLRKDGQEGNVKGGGSERVAEGCAADGGRNLGIGDGD